MNKLRFYIILLSSVLLAISISCALKQDTIKERPVLQNYQQVKLCKNCHERAYNQFKVSMHSRSYSNPVFKAMYFKEIVPRAEKDPEMAEVAKHCMACHNPIAHMTCDETIHTEKDFSNDYANGTCDFCHTINGIKGKEPGNGNYISEPGEKKYGPHMTDTNWHHIYSPLQSSSAFCGTCHNGNNRMGLMTKTTYTEWKKSVYGKRNVTCQTCHMSSIGFLSKNTPVFEKGKAAGGASIISPPDRSELHTHSFPGAYSTEQLSGSVKLQMKSDKKIASPGEKVQIKVRIDSRRAGHKLPTGCTNLRLLWLELKVSGNDNSFIVKAESLKPDSGGFDVAGMGKWDAEIIGDSIEPGNRVYRQVFLDKDGNETMSTVDATEIAFDNRLEAASTRIERYSFKAPGTKDNYVITAKLVYLAYPKSLTRRLGVPDAMPLEVATTSIDLSVK